MRIFRIMAIIIVPLAIIFNVLLFFSYVKVTDVELVRRNVFWKVKSYQWQDLEHIEYKVYDDGDPRYELHYSDDTILNVSSFMAIPDVEAVIEFADKKMQELPGI